MTDKIHTTPEAPRKPGRKKLSRRGIALVLGALVLLALIAGAAGWKHYVYRFHPAIRQQGTIQVRTGTTFEQLTRMLESGGYIADSKRWNAFARAKGLDSVQPGNYTLQPGTSYRTALTAFRYGRQTPVRITFNSVRTTDRLAGIVARYIQADSLSLLEALENRETIRDMGFTPATFPALFIPNTYEVYWTITPDQFIARMHKEYDRFWNQERRAKAEKLGLTPVEVSTLASIVAEETNVRDEMTDVAGVYLNRLRIGQLLQADPTLKYAAGDFSIQRVLDRHKLIDSPYNTYRHAGLPPGPICIPPIQAIDATLAYADEGKEHNYYYFCANADFSGRHVFARTLSEHNRNAAAFHREMNRRGIR